MNFNKTFVVWHIKSIDGMSIFLPGTLLLLIVAGICYTDFRSYLIPNWLNGLLFGSGLLFRIDQGLHSALSAIAFAAAVLVGFWLARLVHSRATGMVGLGLGDAKLGGASAVWFSPWNLPLFLFTASASALIYFGMRHGFSHKDIRTLRIPFGPFLGLSLVVTWCAERCDFFNMVP